MITNNTEYRNAVDNLKLHDFHYWQENNPPISDAEYDQMLMDVAEYEHDFPDEILPDSPTQTLSTATNGNGRKTIRRRTIMLSTEKANEEEKVIKWMKKTAKALAKVGAKHPELFTIEWKYDGDSCSLVYMDGNLIEASYGKGMDGCDCLQHMKHIATVPQTISAKGRVEVRGEVVCPFENLSKTGYKTCRSAASGYLANEVADPRMGGLMMFMPYWCDSDEYKSTLAERFATFFCESGEKAKFRGLSFTSVDGGDNIEIDEVKHNVYSISDIINIHTSQRDSLSFPTDGLVIKAYDMDAWDSLGATDHHPKYSLAYKFPAVQVVANIEYIDYTVGGKTGKLTPMAHFTPVKVSGIVVSQASLGSEKCMAELGLSYDSRNVKCMLGLANDVIPHVYSVIREVIGETSVQTNSKLIAIDRNLAEPKRVAYLEEFARKHGYTPVEDIDDDTLFVVTSPSEVKRLGPGATIMGVEVISEFEFIRRAVQ